MTTYQGVVKGNIVVLPSEAHFADGTQVEVRDINTQRQVAEREDEEAFLRRLRAEGVLITHEASSISQNDFDRTPARVEGKPMSQMVIEDRR